LVVSLDPLILYIYDHTMVLTCLDVYDTSRLTPYNFVCNGGVAKEYWQKRSNDAVSKVIINDRSTSPLRHPLTMVVERLEHLLNPHWDYYG
jgi:hypothetical protein